MSSIRSARKARPRTLIPSRRWRWLILSVLVAGASIYIAASQNEEALVFISWLRSFDYLSIDEILKEMEYDEYSMDQNEVKYPVEKAKGKNNKYNEL